MANKQRILVVDDERQITRVLSRGLTAKGYEVHVAADGEGALQTFSDWHPDLVVTDLSMPNVSGLELCRQLRAFSEVPIIVLSVKGEERTKIEALDAGADDYVTKPFGIDELLARIRATLRRAPVAEDKGRNVLHAGHFGGWVCAYPHADGVHGSDRPDQRIGRQTPHLHALRRRGRGLHA